MDSGKTVPAAAPREYAAFISYRHRDLDRAVARRTHELIEKYRVPRALRRDGKKRLGIVFRDTDELPVSGDLSADIRRALDHSEFLIVICTPDTPDSVWVEKEIRYFLSGHDRNHVLAVLAAGSPESAFPEALTHIGGEIVEPLAANVCAETVKGSLRLLRAESVRLFAAMLGCPYDHLVRREQRRRQKRLTAVLCTCLAVAAGYAGILMHNSRLIEKKNLELEGMNAALTEQKHALQLTESSYLTASAREALDAGDRISAAEYALSALPKEGDDRPYYAPAEAALMEAMGVFDMKTGFSSPADRRIELPFPIRSIRALSDGSAVIVLDDYNELTCVDPASGEVRWHLSVNRALGFETTRKSAVFETDEADGLVHVLCGGTLLAADIGTGSIRWRTDGRYDIMAFYPDGEGHEIICADNVTEDSFVPSDVRLAVLDAATGREKQACPLGKEFGWAAVVPPGISEDKERSFAFGGDGRTFAGTVYDTGGDNVSHTYLYDRESNTVRFLPPQTLKPGQYTLWTGFTAGADGAETLTTVLLSADAPGGVDIRVNDTRDGTVLKEASAAPEEASSFRMTVKTAVMPFLGGVLAAVNDTLYLIDTEKAEAAFQTKAAGDVLSVFPVGELFFGCILSDGTYDVRWWTGSQIYSSASWSARIGLGRILSPCPVGEGLILPSVADNRVEGFLVGDPAGGCGYIAAADADSRQILRIIRAVIFEGLPETVLPVDMSLLNWLVYPAADGLPLLLGSDGSLLAAARDSSGDRPEYRWYLYRAGSDRAEKTLAFSPEETFDSMWPVPEKDRLILLTSGGSVLCHDLTDGSTRTLAGEKQVSLGESTFWGETYNFVASLTKAVSVLEADGSVLTARCDGEILTVWRDGETIAEKDLPDGVSWSALDGLSMGKILVLGKNGTVLLSDLEDGADEVRTEGFALYSIPEDTWRLVPDPARGSWERKIVLGEKEDVFAVFGEDGTLSVRHPSGPDRDLTFPCGIGPASAADLRFICGDRYLALCSNEGALEIYDAGTGDRVFAGRFPAASCGRLSGHTDRTGAHVFLIDHKSHTGLCLSADCRTSLGSFTGVYGFDPAGDALLFHIYGKGLCARTIPSTEELISLGNALE